MGTSVVLLTKFLHLLKHSNHWIPYCQGAKKIQLSSYTYNRLQYKRFLGSTNYKKNYNSNPDSFTNLQSSNNNSNDPKQRQTDSQENSRSSNILVTFKKPDGNNLKVNAQVGKSLYDIVVDNDLDIDGFGACEGTLCCTTCHLILSKEDYQRIGQPKDEELDMLDLAYGLTPTSRLGCQVILKKEFGSELEVEVPEGLCDLGEIKLS